MRLREDPPLRGAYGLLSRARARDTTRPLIVDNVGVMQRMSPIALPSPSYSHPLSYVVPPGAWALRLREGLGRPAQAEEAPVAQMPENADAVKRMSWDDLQAVFALQFAEDIAVVATGEAASVMRRRLSGLGADGRTLLREALDEIEAMA
jgi:hypothetical protein